MDDPALEEDYIDDVIAEIRQIRRWRAEQRSKYGKRWEDELAPEFQSILERGRQLSNGAPLK